MSESIPNSFTTVKTELPYAFENAISAIIRTNRRAEDGTPTPQVIMDRKLGEGGYNEVYLMSWVSFS